MLACLLLADRYSPQTLLALVRALQEGRGAMGACMANTVLRRWPGGGVFGARLPVQSCHR